MKYYHLSKRLATLARYVPKGSRVLDVGSDHAYLPIYLVKTGIIRFGIASEVARGPYHNMVRDIKQAGLTHVLQARLANGLAAMNIQDRLNVITISGMGGNLITQILNEGLEKLVNHPLLILQPNIGAKHLRQWLMHHHYQIIHEQVIEDERHFYEIMVAQGASKVVYNQKQLLFGPILIHKKPLAFKRKWQEEIQHLTMVVRHMERARINHRPQQKIRAVTHKIYLIQQVIQ